MSENQSSSREQGMGKYFFRASAADFNLLPASPIAYWLSHCSLKAFNNPPLSEKATFRAGLQTGDNDTFLRYWHEVCRGKFAPDCKSRSDSVKAEAKWFPHNKGGGFRKWHGNKEYVINWENDGHDIKRRKEQDLKSGKITANNSKCWNQEFYFQDGLTWSSLSSADFSLRDNGFGFLFDTKGQMLFPLERKDKNQLLGILNSKVSHHFLAALSPTLDFNGGVVSRLPLVSIYVPFDFLDKLVSMARWDWNSYETSWDFTSLPLLHPEHRQPTLKASYQRLRAHWRELTREMQHLEEENNRIFIDAYGLQDELTPEVALNEITLTCNPHYRYGGDKTEEELEALLLADTMRELVSYAVGCMLGRYSLDKPGLILADQGETLADYLAQVPQPRFPADDDNVLPMLDGDWFADDITLRFRQFLRVAFGEAHYEDNLAFIELALNVKGKRNYSLRDYFLSEFYADHVKRYKKRPIYWLFSSPKGTFSALVYLHRYRPDTVSVVLSYLRDFRKKLASRLDYLLQVTISTSASQGEKTKASKEAETLKKQLLELDDYERDTLYPLATEQVELDLDDGVKVNYLKLGAALKKIVGLDAKGED